MNQLLPGKCGFYCGGCPTYLNGQCAGCLNAHVPGDCFTRDCVLEQGLAYCGQCTKFPCDTILSKPKSTVLDHDWLLWKRQDEPFDLSAYWKAVLEQDASSLPLFFTEDAVIRWHNSNEQFTVPQFVRVNCEYPGQWYGELQRQERHGNRLTTVYRVQSGECSFHVTSFYMLSNGKFQTLDEYWGDDGPAPKWRREMRLSCPIGLAFYPAQPSDAPTWGRLRRTAWDATYRGIYPDDMIDRFDCSWHLEKDLAKLNHPEFHVYFLRLFNKNVGYLAYRHEVKGVTLNSLYLLPEAQRKGIGKAALDHVRTYCREHGVSSFRLQCNPWNTNAMGFYESMGGTIIKRDTGYEEKMQDSVVYEFPV